MLKEVTNSPLKLQALLSQTEKVNKPFKFQKEYFCNIDSIKSSKIIKLLTNIIQKSPSTRTSQETLECVNEIKNIPAFINISSFLITQMLNFAKIINLDENTTVYSEGKLSNNKVGHDCTQWYIALSGEVHLYKRIDDPFLGITIEKQIGHIRILLFLSER